MSSHVSNNVLEEITYPSQTSTIVPLKLVQVYIISLHTLHLLYYLFMPGLKLTLVDKGGPSINGLRKATHYR